MNNNKILWTSKVAKQQAGAESSERVLHMRSNSSIWSWTILIGKQKAIFEIEKEGVRPRGRRFSSSWSVNAWKTFENQWTEISQFWRESNQLTTYGNHTTRVKKNKMTKLMFENKLKPAQSWGKTKSGGQNKILPNTAKKGRKLTLWNKDILTIQDMRNGERAVQDWNKNYNDRYFHLLL